ncbi:MAG TPA: DNA polymerase III subunit gamma/tau [Candidatus Dormibacteraeota bacterium]
MTTPGGSVRQTLYLKYRPQRFAELVGQEVVAQTLRNGVRDDRLSHAYLFTGIRGTGKTSAARILAKAINCEAPEAGEPCGECAACRSIAEQVCLDVIEIDAATNRGIDEIRDLRERAQFVPSQFKTKVYIIDEAHMLSTEAANAFLKTLEEPPEHACFILATTEPRRLADTVLSRCQQFDFRRIPLDAMAAHLAWICHEEAAGASPDALTLVAEAGAGSLRDALSLLARLLGLVDGELTVEAVQGGLGMADPRALVRLAEALARGDMATAWNELNDLQGGGVEPRQMLRSLGALAKLYLWRELGSGAGEAAELADVPAPPGFWLELMRTAAESAAELRRADDPWMSVEAALLRLCPFPATSARQAVAALAAAAPARAPSGTVEEMPEPQPGPEPGASRVGAGPEAPSPTDPAGEVAGEAPAPGGDVPGPPNPSWLEEEAAPTQAEAGPVGAPGDQGVVGQWPSILAWLGKEHLPVQALLREGRPASHREGVLTIEFDPKFEFHRGMIDSPANRELIQRACLEVSGEAAVVVVTSARPGGVASPQGAEALAPDGEVPSALSQALTVFPGSRVTRLGTAEKR